MTTISQCLTLPNGTPIDGLLVKIDKVWAPPKQINGKFGPTSVQNVSLADVAGNKIRASVWGHADLTPTVGQEVALQSNNGKGIKVMHKPYTDKNGATQPGIELEISKDIGFQSPVVGGKAPVQAAYNAPQSPIAGNPSPSGGIRGEKVGMAVFSKEDGMRFGMCFKLAGDFVLSMKSDYGTMTPDEFASATTDVARRLVAAAKSIEQE